MHARVLILILDLASALLDGHGAAAFRALAAQGDERISPASQAACKIAGWLWARIEMLMEHPERRRIHEAVLPGKFLELRIAFIPQQRITLAIDRVYMRAGGMAVGFLVFASGNLRDVSVHRPVGQNKADVHRAFSTRLELIQLEARQVVNEIGFPDVADPFAEAGGVGAMIAIAFKMLGNAGPIGKRKRVIK